MKILYGLTLAVIVANGKTSTAQISIPSVETQLEASATSPLTFSVSKTSLESTSSSKLLRPETPPDITGISMISVVHPVASERVLDRKYYLLNGLHLGMELLDVELTQRCIANHQCVEGNPLMPSSRGGQLSVNFAYVGYSAFVSYRLKKRHLRLWWISPMTGLAAHTAGVTTGLMH